MSKLIDSKSKDNINVKSEQNYLESKDHSESIENHFAWSPSDDSKLCSLIYQFGTGNWDLISKEMNNNKSAIQCLHRWNSIMKPTYIKGPWNVEEDKKLIDWIKTNGATNWSACAEFIPGRTGKQCRERWMNALNPLLKKGSWEPEEDYIIFKLFKKLGSKWSTISNYIQGRTENSIKNRFYSTLRRIACECKRTSVEKSTTTFNFEEDKDNKLSLQSLLIYFDQAYIEKTKYIDNMVSKMKLNENEILNSGVLKEILQMNRDTSHIYNPKSKSYGSENDDVNQSNFNYENIKTDQFLNQKRLPITHQTNNNYNLNICITPTPISLKKEEENHEADNIRKNLFVTKNSPNNEKNNITTLKKEEYKNLSLDTLASKIDSFCHFTQGLNGNLVNKQSPVNQKKDVDADKIGNLLNQLNDLENLLHMTKNELKKMDNPTYDISYSDKIESNLPEFEMPLNSNKVIIKEHEDK